MKLCWGVFSICLIGLLARGSAALPITNSELSGLSFTTTQDALGDYAGTSGYEVFGMGHAIANGFLYAVVQTNFPEMGLMGSDSYTGFTHYSPGDLYINVGGSFQSGNGTPYGIATVDRGNMGPANVVMQAYGDVWDNVVAGGLYRDVIFADGTLENYQVVHGNAG